MEGSRAAHAIGEALPVSESFFRETVDVADFIPALTRFTYLRRQEVPLWKQSSLE